MPTSSTVKIKLLCSYSNNKRRFSKMRKCYQKRGVIRKEGYKKGTSWILPVDSFFKNRSVLLRDSRELVCFCQLNYLATMHWDECFNLIRHRTFVYMLPHIMSHPSTSKTYLRELQRTSCCSLVTIEESNNP